MKREDYLRELQTASADLSRKTHQLTEAANPLNQLRHGVARDWKWWLPGASVAGFAVARFLRLPRPAGGHKTAPAIGAAFWIPTMLKLLPALLTQLTPLFLSLRSDRKP
jgi:hypothetical protein